MQSFRYEKNIPRKIELDSSTILAFDPKYISCAICVSYGCNYSSWIKGKQFVYSDLGMYVQPNGYLELMLECSNHHRWFDRINGEFTLECERDSKISILYRHEKIEKKEIIVHKKYVSKVAIVEAIKINHNVSDSDIKKFCSTASISRTYGKRNVMIYTLIGIENVKLNDYIVKDSFGSFHHVEEDVFENIYEEKKDDVIHNPFINPTTLIEYNRGDTIEVDGIPNIVLETSNSISGGVKLKIMKKEDRLMGK